MAKKNNSILQQVALLGTLLTEQSKFEFPRKGNKKKLERRERKFKRVKAVGIGIPPNGIPHKGHKRFEFSDGTVIYALKKETAQKKYDKLANS